MDPKKKNAFIEQLNLNYKTVLSYGNKGITPLGEFIVTDIIVDEIPEEYLDMISEKSTARIVLTNIEDGSQELILPARQFFNQYIPLAEINTDLLKIGNDIISTHETIISYLETILTENENYMINNNMFDDIKLLKLEECDADYFINEQNSNSSNICIIPIDLGKWRERIRENLEMER